ncbi:MAG: toprim domain-containing protein [Firmicutes bacterium]|nr:toprim domain-containing protein [Bacillota bacterium]
MSRKKPQIKKITLCLYADGEGQFFAQKIKEKFGEDYELKSHIPKGKDFNEELVESVRQLGRTQKVSDVKAESYELQLL